MNGWQLVFSERFDYSRFNDIVLPLRLSSDKTNQILLRAKVDTGSTFCIFQRRHADLLSIDTETGTQRRIRTATGSFTAYGHEVTIKVGKLEWQAEVYFAEDEGFPVNVVGRVGFLDRLRLALTDYEQMLYLSAYEET
ncbi:MAG TPA: retropepsin-like aspartic protease [Blastocatellia bacterium]|nr:retropepsin-like aspartic protease [Blastocatellia bacterium]